MLLLSSLNSYKKKESCPYTGQQDYQQGGQLSVNAVLLKQLRRRPVSTNSGPVGQPVQGAVLNHRNESPPSQPFRTLGNWSGSWTLAKS